MLPPITLKPVGQSAPVATDDEVTTGTEEASRLISPAQLKLAVLTFAGSGTGTGDMLKAIYDNDLNGVVDAAESINDGYF